MTRHNDINNLGITVEIDDANRAVGLIVPGDMVAIYTVTKDGTVPFKPVVDKTAIPAGPTRTVNGADPDTAPPTIVGFDATRVEARQIGMRKRRVVSPLLAQAPRQVSDLRSAPVPSDCSVGSVASRVVPLSEPPFGLAEVSGKTG